VDIDMSKMIKGLKMKDIKNTPGFLKGILRGSRGRVAILFSTYYTVGVALILFAHYNWFIRAKEAGIPEVTNIEITAETFLRVASWIVLMFFSMLFLILLGEHNVSESSLRGEVLFPAMLFVLTFVGSVIACQIVPLAFNWVNSFCLSHYQVLYVFRIICERTL